MDLINNFLRSQSDGGVANYNSTGTVAMAFMMLVVVFYFIRMRPKFLELLKGLAASVLTFYFMGPAQYFVVWYRSGFAPDQFFAQPANIALGYTLLPLLAWLFAKTFNTSTGYIGDVTALTAFSYHVIGRSGCLFTGCCYGFLCDWGWYSHDAADAAVYNAINQGLPLPEADAVYYCFPTSLVESLFTLAILIFVLVRICKKGYVPDGKNLPYFLLLYGVCRFFSEMTRESTSDLWLFWRISDIHIHMLVMALVGGLLLYANLRKTKAASASAEEPQLPELNGQRR